jgi:hypothetical protein
MLILCDDFARAMLSCSGIFRSARAVLESEFAPSLLDERDRDLDSTSWEPRRNFHFWKYCAPRVMRTLM